MKSSYKRVCVRQLQTTFGMRAYRPGQKAAVHALLSGRDVLCVLPTGAGKSLCWQLPAVVHPGLTIVVTPLIALMQDQLRHLAEKGILAVSINSLMSPMEQEIAVDLIRTGEARILFVSPERLENAYFRQLCCEVLPWLLVVDEAHCILQWGDTFRPAYAGIGDFIRTLPVRPVLCGLTATADGTMQRQISQSLDMKKPKRIMLPVERENLVYEVRTTLDTTAEILRLTRQKPCKTVIFCRTRIRAERLTTYLCANGEAADCYHAGMTREQRMAAQQRFIDGDAQILCATTAFGMGVDIPDIRRIIHDEIPDNLIDYAQQTGRAGRDGEPAICITCLEPRLLILRGRMRKLDVNLCQRWLAQRRKRRRLKKLLRVLLASDCIASGLAHAFGQSTAPCGQCTACRKGRVLKHTPDLAGMKPWQIRLFFLRWQRDALAKKAQCPSRQIASDAALLRAAKTLAFPPDLIVPEELIRLLKHFSH